MNEWQSETTVKEYAAQTTILNVGWYEYEVNFPDLLRLIPQGAKTILDFGCGPAEFTKKLSESFQVTGADMKPMLSIARENHPDMTFVEWSGESPIPKELGMYDVIFSKLVFQFIEDLDLVVENFRNILNSNGAVVCSFPNPRKISSKFGIKTDSVTRYNDKVGNTEIEIHPIYRSQEKYIEIFTNAGFVASEISEPLVSDDILQKYNVSSDYNKIPGRLNIRFVLR